MRLLAAKPLRVMTDILSVAQRSALMAKVRSTGNASTELRLVAVFRALGISGWRRGATLQFKTEKGTFRVKPDFVFRARRLAVFVDGCFWHGCPLHATKPKQNAEFWREKIEANRARDRLVTRRLRVAGWRVLRLWEHELTKRYAVRLLARLRRAGLLEGTRFFRTYPNFNHRFHR
jgi:DNA mismatch endonuclease, patch repair protein